MPLKDTGNGLQGADGRQMDGHLKFRMTPESNFPERHRDFWDDPQVEQLLLCQQDFEALWMEISGLKIFGGEDLSHVSLTKVPRVYEFDLVFQLEDLEIRNLSARVLATLKHVRIILRIHTLGAVDR